MDGLRRASIESLDINYMDTFEERTVTAIQSLPYWVYTIQYILWIVYDIEIYIYVVDCELTVAVVHISLRHRFTHYTAGQYFWLYMTFTMSEVVKLVTAYVNRLLVKVLTYRPSETRLSTILRSFPKDVTLMSYLQQTPQVPLYYYMDNVL